MSLECGECEHDLRGGHAESCSRHPQNRHASMIGSAQSCAALDVLRERHRQISEEGFTPERDDAYAPGTLARAGACYAMNATRRVPSATPPRKWRWPDEWWKPTNRRRDLVKACALLIAEIEHIDRAVSTHAGDSAARTTVTRPDPASPILIATGRDTIAIRAGTSISRGDKRCDFNEDTPLTAGTLTPGVDYGVGIDVASGSPFIIPLTEDEIRRDIIAGFHMAPGGNAEARSGGDSMPAINPHSIWDIGFRPACPDPRGMACVVEGDRRFWIDIYLLGAEHAEKGASRIGADIADGRSLDKLDFAAAEKIMAEHGKRLPTYDEFRAAAFGVTEKSSAPKDPKVAGLDAARTSRFGLMQATGNLWIWGTDGDAEDPRPSIFGGSWFDGPNAGSRFASLVYWPENSNESISARGACDHLQPE